MTPTAARMPLTAPRTLTRKARSQSSVVQVVDAAVRREHAGVADEDVEPAEALDRPRDHRLDLVVVADVGQHRLDRSRPCAARPATVASSDGCADVAQHEVGVGLAGELLRHGGTERPARAGDRHDPSRRRHTSRYPPSTLSTVPVMKADGVGGQELVGAGQVGRTRPSAAARCAR